jgi:hypothetical protein
MNKNQEWQGEWNCAEADLEELRMVEWPSRDLRYRVAGYLRQRFRSGGSGRRAVGICCTGSMSLLKNLGWRKFWNFKRRGSSEPRNQDHPASRVVGTQETFDRGQRHLGARPRFASGIWPLVAPPPCIFAVEATRVTDRSVWVLGGSPISGTGK